MATDRCCKEIGFDGNDFINGASISSKSCGPLHSTPIKALVDNYSFLKYDILDNVNNFVSECEDRALDMRLTIDQMKMKNSLTQSSLRFMIDRKRVDLEEEKLWIASGRSTLKEFEFEIMENFRRQENLLLSVVNKFISVARAVLVND